MVRQGFDDEAESLVREMLARNWHNGLVALYGRIRSSHPEDSLRQAQAWQTRHPANPLLLLTLGLSFGCATQAGVITTNSSAPSVKPGDAKVLEILRAHMTKANAVAEETLRMAKAAMKLDYGRRTLGF